jgi:hypothetical protein
MLDHLFMSYGSITAVDIEQNFDNMRKAWDPQQPVDVKLLPLPQPHPESHPTKECARARVRCLKTEPNYY